MVNDRSATTNIYTIAFVKLFGKNVCENFFKLINVAFEEKSSLEIMFNLSNQNDINIPALDDENYELIEEKRINYLALLTRFRDLDSMVISCALGGGFWDNPANSPFTIWFQTTFREKIREVRININMNRNNQATQYLSHSELKMIFPETKYREAIPNILKPFVKDS